MLSYRVDTTQLSWDQILEILYEILNYLRTESGVAGKIFVALDLLWKDS